MCSRMEIDQWKIHQRYWYIPARSFRGRIGDRNTYHKIELSGSAFAFSGLCKEHLNRNIGEVVY